MELSVCAAPMYWREHGLPAHPSERHVQIGMSTLSSVQSYATAGKLKLLAVASSKRTPFASEVPFMVNAPCRVWK